MMRSRLDFGDDAGSCDAEADAITADKSRLRTGKIGHGQSID
jgi:hypothetical protein